MTTGRRLGPFDATMIVMGGIIGVGVFLSPQRIGTYLSEPFWVLTVWAIGGLIAMTGALTFAELGAAYPHAGGQYVYIRRAFGPFIAFVYACVLLFVITTGALAVVANFFAARMIELIPAWGETGQAGLGVLAGLVIVVLTIANLFGIRIGARIQSVCMVLKLLAIVVLIGGGILYALGDAAPAGALPSAEPVPPRLPLWQGLIVAILPVLFSYGGWQNLSYVSPEIRDPQRNLPRAVILGVIGVILVYTAINWAYLEVLTVDAVATDEGFATRVARATLGDIGGGFVNAAMAISAFGICGVIVMATPHVYVAMARDGLFFEAFAYRNPKTGAPVLALVLQCAVAVIHLVGMLLAQSTQLIDSVAFADWIFFSLAGLSLFIFRYREPETLRPYRVWGYPWVPGLFCVLAIGVVVGAIVAKWETAQLGLGVFAIAGLMYWPWRAWRRPVGERVIPSEGSTKS